MASRREIRDSDDEGSDFGDGIEPGEPNTHDDALVPRDAVQESNNASHDATTDSTDPSFFQRIYDEQQAASDVPHVIPDTAPGGLPASMWTEVSSAPPPGQKPQPKGHSPLTSITDPTPGSRMSKRTRERREAEVIDLTDLTTPRKGAAGGTVDVWDASASTSSQRATRTYGKRRGQQLSLEQEPTPSIMPPTQDPYAFPESTPPARKKTRQGTPSSPAQQAQESSPVMLVPTEEASSSERRMWSIREKNGGFGIESSMPDTAQSLYVAQSTLTTSQKQEYKMVSLSSDAMPDVSETLLPGLPPGPAQVYRSSMATTIAYPTPSRIGSSRRLTEPTDEVDEVGTADTSPPRPDINRLASSPDVLTDMSATTSSRSKRARTKVVSSAGLTLSEQRPPSSTRRAKRKRVVQNDDGWETGPVDGAQGNDRPQQDTYEGGSGVGATQAELDAAGPQPDPPEAERVDTGPMDMPTAPPKPAAKGKRGRKKKGAQTEQPSPDLNEATPAEPNQKQAAPPVDATEPPVKRKRGRPRRSEATQPEPGPRDEPEVRPEDSEAEPINDATPPQPLSGARPNSWAKACSDADANGSHDGDGFGGSIDNNSSKAQESAGNDMTTKELDRKVTKPAVLGQPQKAQYRVGLSKRSRIAPLLKSLKKPV